MRERKEKLAEIIRCGFLPILVADVLDPILLARLCQEAGINTVEYSLRRSDAGNMIPLLKEKVPELTVLAASTIDDEGVVSFLKGKREFPSLDELYQLGADGVVSMLPFREQTYEKYRGRWLFIPGVETAADAFRQVSWGAHLVKFFNTEIFGGPQRLATIQGPTHGVLPVLVTGGMTPEKVRAYLESGALVVAAGFDRILGEEYGKMQKRPDENVIRGALEKYIRAVKDARLELGQGTWTETKNADALLRETGRFFGPDLE